MESNAFQDGQKVLFDAFKHLATLSTGSVLLLATLLKDIFNDNPQCPGLIRYIFISFTLATVASSLTMFLFGHSILKGSKTGVRYQSAAISVVAIAGISFLAGICLLSIFAVMNFAK